MASVRSDLADHFWPLNVGCAVPGGISVLTLGFNLLAYHRPDLVFLKIDLRNAHNCVLRRAMVQAAYDAGGRIRALVPLLWATLSAKSAIILADRANTRAPFDSEEGGQQGSSLASAAFQLALQPAIRAMDDALRAADPDGCARFIADDGTIAAPLASLGAIIDAFELACRGLGLELARAKCAGFCPALGARLADEPEWRRLGFKTGRGDGDGGYGIVIAGTPLGDAAFTAAFADSVVEQQLGASRKITSALLPLDYHATHAMLYATCLPLIDHLVQHLPPTATADGAARFDAEVLRVAESYVPGVRADMLVGDSAALPARLGGLGLRRRASLAPAAFVATCARALPLLIARDVNPPDARVLSSLSGYMPQLEGLFGAGAFDACNLETRFSVFLQSGAPLASELDAAWASLRAEQPGVLDGPLAAPAAALGLNVARGELYQTFQHALTVAREEHAYRDVDARFRALPARTQSRLAWLSKDAFSRALVVSFPTPACHLRSAEFAEAATQYLGLPSPAVAAARGARLRGAPVDVYGNALASTQTTGGYWDAHHDNVARFLVAQSRENGLGAVYEPTDAYTDTLPRGPRGIFVGLSRDGTDGAPSQRGITPDLRVRAADGLEVHYDVKVVHVGVSAYADTNGAAAARGAAVNSRARRVMSEYERHARRIDERCAGTRAGDDGPVLRRLREVGVTGLAVGAFGEASDDAHNLLNLVATTGAAERWRDAMAPSPLGYRSVLVAQLRRVWGCFFARENARLKLARLALATGAGRCTHAARGLNRAQRARRDAEFFLFHSFGWRTCGD
jgi:hypothetical protein